jgi:aspartate/methionine/tyrosine aminotransferase
LRRAGRRLLDLTTSNPTAVGIPYPERELREALSPPEVDRYEPEPFGTVAAREAVAARYAAAGTPVDPSRIVLTASTSESYGFLFKLLADPGDAVMVPVPGYPLFDYLGRLESVATVPYPLDPDDGWSLHPARLEEAAPERARAVVLVNPGNPTGRFLHRGEHAGLVNACRERGWAIVSDEVFGDYARSTDPDRVACAAVEARVLTFSLGGLSKGAGLPQVKLGWIVVGGPGRDVAEAMERLETIADAYLSASVTALRGLPRLLAVGDVVRPHIRARVEANHRALEEAVAGSPCALEASEGGWYGVLRVPATRTGEAWAVRILEADGVLVHPGYFYDFPREAWLVVSLLPPPEPFREAVARLVRRVLAEA